MQVGHDQQKSTICKSRLWFGLDKQLSTLVLKFNFIFFNQQRLSADGILIPNLHKALFVACNSMTDTLIIEKATEEIQSQSFGFTQQFLEIHQIEYSDNKPKVSRVDTEKEDGTAIVYFPVVDQKFYVAVYLDTYPEISVRHVNTESFHSVYFIARSEVLSFNDLSALTTLKPTGGWDKGDKKRFGDSVHKFSCLNFEPNLEADEFDDKIEKLLAFLEKDKEGIKALVDKANGYIQVTTSFHNGNTMLGGHHLDKNIIKRLGSLNLEIDFDIYADGNYFKEP